MATNSHLNIRSEITRLKGFPGERQANRNEALMGPVSPNQILGNALEAIQNNDNTVQTRLRDIERRLAALEAA